MDVLDRLDGVNRRNKDTDSSSDTHVDNGKGKCECQNATAAVQPRNDSSSAGYEPAVSLPCPYRDFRLNATSGQATTQAKAKGQYNEKDGGKGKGQGTGKDKGKGKYKGKGEDKGKNATVGIQPCKDLKVKDKCQGKDEGQNATAVVHPRRDKGKEKANCTDSSSGDERPLGKHKVFGCDKGKGKGSDSSSDTDEDKGKGKFKLKGKSNGPGFGKNKDGSIGKSKGQFVTFRDWSSDLLVGSYFDC